MGKPHSGQSQNYRSYIWGGPDLFQTLPTHTVCCSDLSAYRPPPGVPALLVVFPVLEHLKMLNISEASQYFVGMSDISQWQASL